MRLSKLSSNKEDFKTVIFNPIGITLIVGQRSEEGISEDKQSTYNSVGKSLIIAIIHFCLGSSGNAEFEEKLPDWEFALDFYVGDALYTARRSCSNQKVVTLNNEEIKISEYTKLLMGLVFISPEKVSHLSFRSLISRFIRPTKASYNSYDNYIPSETPYAQLLNNGFLLGLDPKLIENKFLLKQELDQVDEFRKRIPKDPILKHFFDKGNDSGAIEAADLRQRIDNLKNNIIQYKIADDYYNVLKEADKLKLTKKQYEVRSTSLRNAILQIDKSLQWQPDLPSESVIEMYKEAQVILNDSIVKSLKEVEEFNRKLIENRRQRLLVDRAKIIKELNQVESQVKSVGQQMEQKLQYLDGKGALEGYNNMVRQEKDLEINLNKIETYRRLLEEYKIKNEELKQDFSRQNIEAHKYLMTNSLLLEKNLVIFRNLVNELYGEYKKAGIDISIDDGVNQNRFIIKAKIDDDTGDGVGAVKIFCFDWTLLRAMHNHNVKFIFHDSRLLSEIDSRQVATLFKIVHRTTLNLSLQYIISSNQYVLDALKTEMNEEEYETIINNSIKLKLTDESDKSRLLGMKVDLDYEKGRTASTPLVEQY